ncbi:MAG: hypothetical protein K2P88_02180 [Chitinophagaceae bacterium]|uniref:hypothetical protein n=1 Tax=unclassified Paraflavitalea TaxID=2798305 RepID=UPI003D345487|nr:hypothetical protein [Chitinophagaceae bacterium]
MKKLRLILYITVTLLVTYKSYSQNNPYKEVNIASPTAASLGKYADFPVNSHTGLPQVSIPIYSIKYGSIGLPISLSYFAGGLKVMEPASWVGANWSLNAGGVITRSVQGAPDERNISSATAQDYGHLSNKGYNNYLWVPGATPYSGAPGYAFSQRQDYLEFAEGRKDGEPDIFYYNFAGISGKFYFHDDGSVITVPKQDLVIKYGYTPGVGKSIDSFLVITPDGTKYQFGRTSITTDTDPVEKTFPFDGVNTYQGQVVSSWYLNKIESADGVFAINLTYAPENYSYYTYSAFPVDASSSGTNEYKVYKNITNGVRLSQVSWPNGVVNFNASSTARLDLNGDAISFVDDANTQAKALQSITISDGNSMCKSFNFSYGYFQDNTTNVPSNFVPGNNSNPIITKDRNRLKLETVQESSCDNSVVIPAYSFEYFTEFVPRRLSFGVDHWGFINGANSNTGLVPTYTVNTFTQVNGANRDAAWPAMRAGSLKRINYPTGGYTDFDFEAHKTWVSYTKGEWQFRFTQAAGGDASPNWVVSTRSFTGNTYKLTFTNSNVGTQAFLNVYRVSDNVQVNGWVLEAGASFTTNLNYPVGSYRIEMKKLTNTSGYPAIANFDEWITSAIQKDETVGGLRIKTITHYDGVSVANNQVTNYSYFTNGKSTGILYSRPTYVYKIRNDIWRDVGFQDGPNCGMYGCVDCNGSAFAKSGATIRPLSTTQGNHIGYNEVKESRTGGGYTVYRYYGSDLWDINVSDVAVRSITTNAGCEPGVVNYPFVPYPFEYKRGDLKYVGVFNESGQILKETEYYHTYVEDSIKTPALMVAISPIAPVNAMLPSYYNLVTSKKVQMQVVEKDYAPGSSASMFKTSNTYFESPYHTMATRTSATSSKGEVLESRIKYSFDYRVANCDTIKDGWNAYATSTAAALLRYNQRKDTCSTHLCRWWAWQAYIKELSDLRITYVNTRKTKISNDNSTYNSCMLNWKDATADALLKPVLELRARNMNTPIETTSWNANNLMSASFVQYGYAISPSSMPVPAKVFSLPVSTISPTFVTSTVNTSTMVKDSRYEEESSAKFANGNLVEILPKSGVLTSYIWGLNNSVPIVKASGVSYANLKTAYDAVSGNLNTLRSQSLLTNAFVNTYEYNSILGLLKETNHNSRNQTYEYDGLFRLLRIRDHNTNIVKQYEYKFRFGVCAPLWQNEGSVYCETSGGSNTGNQVQLQRDMNPCSASYNTTRTVVVAYNTTSCPVSLCNSGNCLGPDKKCINDVCSTGWKVYTGSTYDYSRGLYICTFHYEWSDGSWSPNYTEESASDCSFIM